MSYKNKFNNLYLLEHIQQFNFWGTIFLLLKTVLDTGGSGKDFQNFVSYLGLTYQCEINFI